MSDPHNPYYVTPRKRLSDKQRLEMFVEHKGICCICGLKIDAVREMWDEHEDPLWRNGTNAKYNRAPAHARCAGKKSAREARERAKGRHVAEYHFGAKRAKTRPMPCGRRSKYKRKMDGTIVER